MKQTISVLKSATAFLILSWLYQQTCLAQIDAWERVNRIEQGKNVDVKLHSGEKVKGRIESWSPEGFGLRTGKEKVVQVAKSDVAQVAIVRGMSRGRKAAWAGLIGGLAGGGAFAGICLSNPNNCDVPPAGLAAGGALLGGGIAAGIAAMFPQHEEILYKSESASSGGSK